ncbi:hypothetical protein BT63DRAFT_412819 [Microthyrium microscopicum]|uniref:Uncharacterized protein n=1 Tax=Microthyrium microscopicum TaxID=703497 RepID=A0A6A6UEI3_9PEZI|nr:hypothetical protein BT63DRAFT_412819 [Microthyrium microscopicum]
MSDLPRVTSSTSSSTTSSNTFVAITTVSPVVFTPSPSTTSSFFTNATAAIPTFATDLPVAAHNGGPSVQAQALGGIPSPSSDLAASGLGIFLFFLGFLAHVYQFRHNKNRGRFFPFSVAVAVFCFIRLITLSLRMAWGSHQTDASLALAAGVFVAAGTVILYIVNGSCLYRHIRSQHPHVGESLLFRIAGRFFLLSILVTLCFLIIAAIQSAYTSDIKVRHIDRSIQLYGTTFFAIIAFLPIPFLLLSHVTAHRPPATSSLGSSTARRRILIIIVVAALLTFRAAWICGTTWPTPVPGSQPLEWYFTKPVFYLVSLVPELLVVYLLFFLRMDRHFYIGPHGTFDSTSSSQNSKRGGGSPESTFVTPTQLATHAARSHTKSWSTASDEEAALKGYTSRHEYAPQPPVRQHRFSHTPAQPMSPVSEERSSNSLKRVPIGPSPLSGRRTSISQKNSHESLNIASGRTSMDTTYTGPPEIDTDYPVPPIPREMGMPRGPSLSLISTFPDGRNSIAMDPATGQYHLVTPLIPAANAYAGSTLSLAYSEAPQSFYLVDDARASRGSPATLVPSPPHTYPVAPQMATYPTTLPNPPLFRPGSVGRGRRRSTSAKRESCGWGGETGFCYECDE